jgi:hypothetical protein
MASKGIEAPLTYTANGSHGLDTALLGGGYEPVAQPFRSFAQKFCLRNNGVVFIAFLKLF